MTKQEQEYLHELKTLEYQYHHSKSYKRRNDLIKCIHKMKKELRDYQRFQREALERKQSTNFN